MDRQTFEAELKRDGYDILTNTTPGVKVNPEHSHPFDVRAMVRAGRAHRCTATAAKPRPTSPARPSPCRAAACTRRATGRKARWSCSAARCSWRRDSMARSSLIERRTRHWQLGARSRSSCVAFALSLLALCGLIAWLQNVHIITANGMYKSIQAEPWIADPAHARLDPSNYLYFPLYGALCRLLDCARHRLRGVPWKQFAYLNAFWASLAIVYRLRLRPSPDRQRPGGRAGRLLPPRLRLLPAAGGDQRGHHAGLHAGAGRDGAGRPVVRPADPSPRGAGRRALHAGLADRMAADVPDPARAAPGAGAVAGAAGCGGGADRHAGRLDRGRRRHRRSSVRAPQRRGRPARHPVDRQGRGHRLGRPLRGTRPG